MNNIEQTQYSPQLNPLLLLADPSEEAIAAYTSHSDFWIFRTEASIQGVLVVQLLETGLYEIKNLAVDPECQRQGIGRQLLRHVLSGPYAGNCIRICTGNSSTHQLRLYQQMGFELVSVQWNYFRQHYPEPIVEDGMACLHQMVLEQSI